MALLATNVERTLDADLVRVGNDPTAKFEAHKAAMERFVRICFNESFTYIYVNVCNTYTCM